MTHGITLSVGGAYGAYEVGILKALMGGHAPVTGGKPLDPTIYLVVSGLLTLVAAASCFVPARRATRVNPMVALRTE